MYCPHASAHHHTHQRLTLHQWWWTNINGQCLLPTAYLTTPVCPSDAFQSMVLLHAPVCTSQNLRLQSSDPLTIRRSSNCKHVTASWCPGNVITHAPSNVHSCNRMRTMSSCCTGNHCDYDLCHPVRESERDYTGSCLQRVWLQPALDYNKQISLHQNHWLQMSKVRLHWAPTYKEQFLLHHFTRCKRDPVFSGKCAVRLNLLYHWFNFEYLIKFNLLWRLEGLVYPDGFILFDGFIYLDGFITGTGNDLTVVELYTQHGRIVASVNRDELKYEM